MLGDRSSDRLVLPLQILQQRVALVIVEEAAGALDRGQPFAHLPGDLRRALLDEPAIVRTEQAGIITPDLPTSCGSSTPCTSPPAIPIASRMELPPTTSGGSRATTPCAMPVRSLTPSLLRRPEPELVLRQVKEWAERVAAEHPGLVQVGVFGSYGRGDAGVGSDLDLLLIDTQAHGPQHQRLLAWPLAELPLSCDALVLTPAEHHKLLASGSAMAAALARDSRWLWSRGGADG